MISCFECGRPASERHHVVPKSLGGVRTLARVLYHDGFSLQQVAEALDAEGLPTLRGGKWYPTTVRRLILGLGCRTP